MKQEMVMEYTAVGSFILRDRDENVIEARRGFQLLASNGVNKQGQSVRAPDENTENGKKTDDHAYYITNPSSE